MKIAMQFAMLISRQEFVWYMCTKKPRSGRDKHTGFCFAECKKKLEFQTLIWLISKMRKN